MSRGMIRIYGSDGAEHDAPLSQLLVMAGESLVYFHNESPDTGWYLRPNVTWRDAIPLSWPRKDDLGRVAMGLLSDEGDNPEYDRAIGELVAEMLGLPLGDGQPGRIVEALRHIRDGK